MGINRDLLPNGVNVARTLHSRGSTRDAFLVDEYTQPSSQQFVRCVVHDVITSIDSVPKEKIEHLLEKGLPENLLKNAPRNALIVSVVGNAQARALDTYALLFPFFSPHFALPVKPGETVWAFFEKDEPAGYWLSRVHEHNRVDDVNFTHADRRLTVDGNKVRSTEKTQDPPRFLNGSGESHAFTLGDKDTFERIFREAAANEVAVYEVVPRYRKRPGDLVIQGSNNALICLGHDRPEGFKTNKPALAGAIDAVVGRGSEPTEQGTETKGTSPSIIENTRGYKEVNKNPLTDKHANINEGDPDFINDRARFYMSMKSDPDAAFGLNHPENLLGGKTESVTDVSVAVLKADHVRIISRQDGSIRIIKEGENPASVVIHENGTVHVDAAKIQLGRDAEGDRGYVRYSQYKDQMEHLTGLLKALYNEMIKQFTAGPNTTPGYGGPNPGLVALQTGGVADALKSVIELENKIPNAKSENILGE